MRNCKLRKRLAAAAVLGTVCISLLANSISALSITSVPLSANVPSVTPIAVPEVREQKSLDKLTSVIHYGPWNSGAQIGCMEDGTELTVLREKGSFYEIDCYDMKGYIAKSQVRKGEDGKYYVNCQADSAETKRLPTVPAQDMVTLRSDVRTKGMSYRGVRYVAGGSSPRGFDCSGFTQYIYRAIGLDISRTVTKQLTEGVVIAKEDMQCGDLVFFKHTTSNSGIATHVGMYIGNGQLIHAGTKGIAVVDLSTAYYEYHFLCVRRVILPDSVSGSAIASIGTTQDINSSYWRMNSNT